MATAAFSKFSSRATKTVVQRVFGKDDVASAVEGDSDGTELSSAESIIDRDE